MNNTITSDINELYLGFLLNGKKWFCNKAEEHYSNQIKKLNEDVLNIIHKKTIIMFNEFNIWSSNTQYQYIKNVWWTAKPGSLTKAIGFNINQKDNPSDLLIITNTNHFLGLSLKYTTKNNDICFKNPGIGTIDKRFDLNLRDFYEIEEAKIIKRYSLPVRKKIRKDYIRDDVLLQTKMNIHGLNILTKLRDILCEELNMILKVSDKRKQFLDFWLDLKPTNPPFIKITGYGLKEPYARIQETFFENCNLDLYNTIIETIRLGNETIGILNNTHRLFKIRFKFESQKLASSIKLVGEPWT